MTDDIVAQSLPSGQAPKDRSSVHTTSEEPIAASASPNRSPTEPARIRKKRSSTTVPTGSRVGEPPSATNSLASTPTKAASKASLRNVVRRLFGRKPKPDQREPPKLSTDKPPSRHGYSTSDPGELRTILEQPQEGVVAVPNPPQRTLSAPIKRLDPPRLRKGRSAYAVEFPQSSRLKPLDLGNPFHRDSREPRRRATLPSIIIDDREAAALARAINVRDDDQALDQGVGSAIDDDRGIGLAVTTPTRNNHRRSRSVDDLRHMVQSLEPARDRDGEVEFWRQSALGNLLGQAAENGIEGEAPAHDALPSAVSPVRLSQDDPFVVQGTGQVDDDGQVSPLRDDTVGKVSPMRDSPLMSHPGTVELATSDLESRVLRLEDNLASFQSALDRLTARANHRTIIIDSAGSNRTSRQNTPSVLINSLLDADYRYSNVQAAGDENYTVRGGPAEEPQRPRQPMSQPSPARTHAALYSIINQERIARRALEDQLRSLQESFVEMQYQLSQPIIGRHSSAYQPQPHIHSAYQRVPHFSNVPNTHDTEASGQRLTSRFSMSESLTDSEAARLRETRDLDVDEDRTKSFDLYQTPADEQRQTAQHVTVEGGMF